MIQRRWRRGSPERHVRRRVHAVRRRAGRVRSRRSRTRTATRVSMRAGDGVHLSGDGAGVPRRRASSPSSTRAGRSREQAVAGAADRRSIDRRHAAATLRARAAVAPSSLDASWDDGSSDDAPSDHAPAATTRAHGHDDRAADVDRRRHDAADAPRRAAVDDPARVPIRRDRAEDPARSTVGSTGVNDRAARRGRRGRDRRRRRRRRGRAASPSGRGRRRGSRSPSSTSTRSLAYDLAHAASAVEGCRVMLDYGEHGEVESLLARAYVADAVADVGRPAASGATRRGASSPDACADAQPFVAEHRAPEFLESLADAAAAGTAPARRTSPTTSSWSRETFHRFAEDKIRPVAEHVHRDQRRHPRGHHRRAGRARRVRPVGARGVRRVRDRRRVRLPRHGRRHRGALVGLARRRRLAHHPPRDPHPRASSKGGTEEQKQRVAAADRERRADGRRHGDRARLRLRRRRREGRGDRRPTAATSSTA